MDEAIYKGFAQFSDSRVSTALDLLLRSPGPYRLIISDRQVLIDARWRWLRPLLSTRSRDLSDVDTARLRGLLVLLNFRDGSWWSFSTTLHSRRIIEALKIRGVAVLIDQ